MASNGSLPRHDAIDEVPDLTFLHGEGDLALPRVRGSGKPNDRLWVSSTTDRNRHEDIFSTPGRTTQNGTFLPVEASALLLLVYWTRNNSHPVNVTTGSQASASARVTVWITPSDV